MAQSSHLEVPTLPGGENRGKLINDPTVPDSDLGWWAKNAKQAPLRDACVAELARRKALPQDQRPAQQAPQQQDRQPEQRQADPPPQSRALARVDSATLAKFSGAFRDAERATAAMLDAAQLGHVVAPGPICATLPQGCEVAIAAVTVDVENETYKVPGGRGGNDDDDQGGQRSADQGEKRGLAKVSLDKIAGAAGVSWHPTMSRRLDDGSDPYYCHYKAVGVVKDFDGSSRVIQGEKEVDMRERSPQVEAIRQREAKKKRDYEAKRWTYKGDGGDGQIREIRLHILGHAETKARLRAVRSLGIRTSYTRAELAKPFVVCKVQFTGRTDDPALRDLFASKIADSFLNAGNMLYGNGATPELPPAALAPQAPQHPQALPPQAAGHTPPPVGSVPADDGAITADGHGVDEQDDDPNYGPPRQTQGVGPDGRTY